MAANKLEEVQASSIDIGQCRAATIGIEMFGECLCKGPNACEYALPFGYAFLCQHPRIREIIQRSEGTAREMTSGS